LDIAHNFMNGHLIRYLRIPSLMNNRQRSSKAITPNISHPYSSHIGRNDSERITVKFVFEVFQQNRHRKEMINRTVKEPLNLGSMQVNRHDAVSPGRLE